VANQTQEKSHEPRNHRRPSRVSVDFDDMLSHSIRSITQLVLYLLV
jgi:hypothetical protein